MYTILVIITSKWKITTLLVFEKMSFVWCRMSGIATQKCYCMAGKLLFLFPTTLDRLRMSSQVLSNKFIADWLLTKILTCTVCRNTWHPTSLNVLPFLSDNKKHKVWSILPFKHSSAGNRHTGKSVLRNLFLFLT